MVLVVWYYWIAVRWFVRLQVLYMFQISRMNCTNEIFLIFVYTCSCDQTRTRMFKPAQGNRCFLLDEFMLFQQPWECASLGFGAMTARQTFVGIYVYICLNFNNCRCWSLAVIKSQTMHIHSLHCWSLTTFFSRPKYNMAQPKSRTFSSNLMMSH